MSSGKLVGMDEPAPYHHGDLRQAILAAAAAAVARDGVAALSLRSLAQQVGVSHTAPRHHFGDKRGVVTALAAEGYDGLAAALAPAAAAGSLLEAGLAYVGWVLDHPAHYQVMFRPDLVDGDDAGHAAAIDALRRALVASLPGDGGGERIPVLGLAAWSIVHGFVTLSLAGSLPVPAQDREGTLELARATLARLDTTEPATPEG